jgi:hypothetical protein
MSESMTPLQESVEEIQEWQKENKWDTTESTHTVLMLESFWIFTEFMIKWWQPIGIVILVISATLFFFGG